MKYYTSISMRHPKSNRNQIVLSKLPHPGIPEHRLCRAIHILGDDSYLARANGTVLLSVDQLMIDIQVQDVVVGDDSYQVGLT